MANRVVLVFTQEELVMLCFLDQLALCGVRCRCWLKNCCCTNWDSSGAPFPPFLWMSLSTIGRILKVYLDYWRQRRIPAHNVRSQILMYASNAEGRRCASRPDCPHIWTLERRARSRKALHSHRPICPSHTSAQLLATISYFP